MSKLSDRSAIKSNRLREIIQLMQQGEITTADLMKKYNISSSMARFDIALIEKEVAINKINKGGKKVYYSITDIVDFDTLECLKAKIIVRNLENLKSASTKEIKEKIESDILGKKVICRTGLLDWFCNNFEGRQDMPMRDLINIINSYGVKVVNV